jgi:hypothetical protein
MESCWPLCPRHRRYLSLIYVGVFILIPSILLIISEDGSISYGNFDLTQTRAPPRLCFVILSSNLTKGRVRPMMEAWGNSVRYYPAISDFYFLSIEDPAMSDLPSIDLPPSYSDLYPKLVYLKPHEVSVQLVIKDAYAMEYCVTNTSADWCFRLMDDLYINEEGLDDFIEHLRTLPDPRTTAMVFGNCMDTKTVQFYLQGGSGYMFSRRAAELMVAQKNDWIVNVREWEDFHLTNFLTSLNLTSQDVDSPYFTGHFIRWAWWDRFKWNNTEIDFPDCPDEIPEQRECSHRLFPYHKVVFVHALKAYMTEPRWQKWFAEAPRDAWLYYGGTGFNICRGKFAIPAPNQPARALETVL